MINLERRPERLREHKLESFNIQVVSAIDGRDLTKQTMLSAPVRKNWRDPFKNRRLTKGEYACFQSHLKCWKLAAECSDPVLILEDDVIFTPLYDEDTLLQKFTSDIDIIFLGYNENNPSKVVYHGDGFVTPDFPYNAHAYLIHPNTAKKLIQLTEEQDFSIIPVDDWIAEKFKQKRLNVIACEDSMANQQFRSVHPSDIEPGFSDWFCNYNIHVLTCATDEEKAFRLFNSAEQYDIEIVNLGKGVDWKGTDMSGPGGGQKINLIREYIEKVPDTDIVFFVDGYDVFFADTLDSIMDRWSSFNTRALFGAEKVCWPDTSIQNLFPEQDTPYKYLNSGTFIAEVETLRQLICNPVADFEDDQLYIQKEYIKGELDIKIDYEQYIFQTYDEAVEFNKWGQVTNKETNCTGCLFHGNGGPEAKLKLDSLYNEAFLGKDWFIKPKIIKNLDKDMLEIAFLSEKGCREIIEIAENHGKWEPLPYDKFPAQEIRLSEIGILSTIERFWEENIVPIIEEYWSPIKMYGLRDAFVMKYTPDTQNKLALHHDASLVTGSIKLNDEYEGGSLVYPRQNTSNNETEVGRCILFPGQVTHGHQCEEITKGTKYSLTIWTCRFPGDSM